MSVVVSTIADACDLVTDGTHYTPRDIGNGIPFLTVKDVTDDELDFCGCSFISEEDYKTAVAGNSAPKCGDVLFSKDGTVGKVHVVSTKRPFAVLSSLAILRPKAESVDAKYLGYALRSPGVLGEALKKKTGSAIRRIVLSDLKEVRFPLPLITEQHRIAAILAKADDIRKKRRVATESSDGLMRSVFLHLVGSLPDERVSIEELLTAAPNAIRTGPFGSQLLHSEFTENGIPVLGIDNVVTNRFRWAERRYVSHDKYRELRRYRVFPGDVMITIMGTTGRVCIAPEDLPECISTKHLCTITPNRQRLLPEYLWASLLWDPVVRAQATREGKGAIMEGWNMGLVRGLMIKLPSISQQEHFAAFVRKVEGLRTKFLAAEAESNQLFGSLSQRAFSGLL